MEKDSQDLDFQFEDNNNMLTYKTEQFTFGMKQSVCFQM